MNIKLFQSVFLILVIMLMSVGTYGQSKGKKKAVNNTRDIILKLHDVDLRAVIDTFSRATGRSFLVDDRLLKGKKVNFKSDKRYTIKEAFSIFEAILDAEGLAMVKENEYTKIVAKNDSTRILTPTRVGKAEQAENFVVTQVIQLKNSDANIIRNTIQPFITTTTNITQYPPENLIIIRDKYQNIKRIKELIRLIDVKHDTVGVKRFQLSRTNVSGVINILNKAFQAEVKRGNAGGKIGLFPENDKNSLIVVGDLQFIKRVGTFIKRLDADNVSNATEARTIDLQYATTASMTELVKKLFSDGKNKKLTYQIIQVAEKKLMVFSTESVFRRILGIITKFDVSSARVNLEIIPVKNASANDMVKLINSIFSGSATKKGATTGKTTFKLLADERSNKIIILAKDTIIHKVKLLLREFDKKIGVDGGNYRVFRLNYTSAEELAKVLQGVTKGIISDGKKNKGVATRKTDISIIPDKSTNSLVVYASTEQFDILEKIVKELDIVRPQVYVEAMIMEVTINKSLNLGVDWKVVQRATQDGETQAAAILTGGGQTAGLSSFPTTPSDGAVVGVFGKPFTFGNQTFGTFSAFIRAQQTSSEVNVLSSPQIMTLNNVKAKIKSGEVRGFEKETTVDANGNTKTTYDYKDVGVELEITPQINPDESIRMDIATKFTTVNPQTSGQQNVLNTFNREISTSISVKDDHIIVLGGLISDKIDFNERKIPCLGDIPFVGWLFKSTTETNEKTNLLIFISPKIISSEVELKAKIKKIKQGFNDAANEKFRMNVSDEFGLPSIKKLNIKKQDDDETVEDDETTDTKQGKLLRQLPQPDDAETAGDDPKQPTEKPVRIENFDTGDELDEAPPTSTPSPTPIASPAPKSDAPK